MAPIQPASPSSLHLDNPPHLDHLDDVTHEIQLDALDSSALSTLCGQLNCHIKHIETRLGVRLAQRGNRFAISGYPPRVTLATKTLQILALDAVGHADLSPEQVHLVLQEVGAQELEPIPGTETLVEAPIIRTKKGSIKPRGLNQQLYVHAVRRHDINFGIGPAGTGKTYLAVACAVESLLREDCERILLVRPAVEAGEKLGFLPGDLSQKVDPYLRPLYDALYEMLGFEPVGKLIEKQVIEIAPLAYMRGRTLNNAFVILDESQNTTREQMKMFLTRIGFGSTAVITGDPTQIDLPRGTACGLQHAIEVLKQVKGISFTHFTSKDVVRHPLVKRIVEAYDAYESAHPGLSHRAPSLKRPANEE